uniref:Protein kinase domain-containing protein n=1 Tax=Romanomermis culicivorax TaxID=13658 RepID=A0A915IT36_ROMCU
MIIKSSRGYLKLMNRERCQYWASAHYVWRTDPADVLGEGAFGDVYRGFHKETCQYVAIKTFKKLNLRKSSETQLREIQILERLNHLNVVKLIAIEDILSIARDENQSDDSFLKGKALIMEYCTEGNLYSIIEQPENQFGLDEAEMLRVLDHTTSGMKYLRENKIIHRDWKPSNILKTITEDGNVLYKLCDFGAARELDDNQAFVSIVGTEEYILSCSDKFGIHMTISHFLTSEAPDIYGRALLGHGSSSQSFSATSELWSYAVTVYHVTTGQLPFRPFGGRTNRSTMYQITSEKPSAAISGVQDVENGPIKYSNSLPDHCRLSKQFNKFLTYLLANLFQVNRKEKAWSFDEFFRVVEEFLSKLRIHCSTPSSKFSCWIYIDKSAG